MVDSRSMTAQTVSKAVDSQAPSPAEFQDGGRIAASAVPWRIPADLAQGGAPNSVLGRRILVSISPKGEAYGMQIVSSELAVSPFGGTFREWAQLASSPEQDGLRAVKLGHESIAAEASGIEVTPGRLR